MKRLINLSLCLLMCFIGFSVNVFADDDINYQTYFNAEEVEINIDADTGIYVVTDASFEDILFSSNPVDETVYTTDRLKLRTLPTVDSAEIAVVDKNVALHRVGFSAAIGWDIIEYNDSYYFMWNEFLTTDKPKFYSNFLGVEAFTSDKNSNAENEAKEWVGRRESGNDYTAISPSGKYYGKYQLSIEMLNGDYSIENQEKVADEYVYNRYGSWQSAKQHSIEFGWY